MHKQTRLEDKLPSTVESLRSGWLGTFKSAAVVSALLAGTAGQLLVFVKDADNLPTTPSQARTCLILLSYLALVFNCSAAITSLILTDRLGELLVRASRRPHPFLEGTTSTTASSLKILKRYGIGASWNLVMCHWFFCLLAGITCIMGQILLYIFLQESNVIKITITCVVGITILPLLVLLPCSSSDEESSKV